MNSKLTLTTKEGYTFHFKPNQHHFTIQVADKSGFKLDKEILVFLKQPRPIQHRVTLTPKGKVVQPAFLIHTPGKWKREITFATGGVEVTLGICAVVSGGSGSPLFDLC